MTPRTLIIALAAVAALAAFLLWPAPPVSDEEQIRQLVASAVAAAGKGDAAGVTEAIAEDFVGQGGASRQEVKQLVLGQLMRSRDGLSVVNTGLTVTVSSPTEATFSGTFLFARGGLAALGTGDGAHYRIEATLARRSPGWQITGATWARE